MASHRRGKSFMIHFPFTPQGPHANQGWSVVNVHLEKINNDSGARPRVAQFAVSRRKWLPGYRRGGTPHASSCCVFSMPWPLLTFRFLNSDSPTSARPLSARTTPVSGSRPLVAASFAFIAGRPLRQLCQQPMMQPHSPRSVFGRDQASEDELAYEYGLTDYAWPVSKGPCHHESCAGVLYAQMAFRHCPIRFTRTVRSPALYRGCVRPLAPPLPAPGR